MNPRHRRLLIPGLLIALLVVVLVSSLARRADGAEAGPDVVSHLSDARITESSGLAVSVKHDDLAYTINDSGNAPIIFAVKISTGAVVGTTTITGNTPLDTEAIAIDGDGELWVADTGDNQERRTDVALYALPEPGPGEHSVAAERYPLTYTSGPADVETLLINPRTGAKGLVTKGLFAGELLSLPSKLSTQKPNVAKPTGHDMPALVTDGVVSANGRFALLRTYSDVHLYDAKTWKLTRSHETPPQPQGESIALERSQKSFLIGSEGANSALIRVALTLPKVTPVPKTETTPAKSTGSAATSGGDNGFAGSTWIWAIGVVALLAAIASAATRRT
ncbi:hypothetical protein [Aeromicrobium sp. 9AM]|uniref:hypothetical protein n=1 Tax=Aeromicrobium sp. 9AM TaxID=2653126 RepID=UPI0012F14996|nr:hypothetical protein [Aeromicrobium sp. 9AM]VXB67132.1 conserved exported hypothetical protein [Aeromicrobium sp. 9AM]